MPTQQEIRDAVAADVKDGIRETEVDGERTQLEDPTKRLAAADRLATSDMMKKKHRGLRFTKLISPPAG